MNLTQALAKLDHPADSFKVTSQMDPLPTPLPFGPIGVVLNPTSGRGQAGRRRTELEGLLESAAPGNWFIIETTGPGGGIAAAESALARGPRRLAAAGGDGTLSEVVSIVAGTEVGLAVLPMGTGNDFARTLGFGTDLSRAVSIFASAELRAVDLAAARTSGGDWKLSINLCACGFDAVVGEKINRGYRWVSGTAAYLLAVLSTLFSYRAASIVVHHSGGVENLQAMLAGVANAQSYGGGMKLAPQADLFDGLLDMVVIQELPKLEFLRQFPKVFAGAHLDHPRVLSLKSSWFRIESSPNLPVLVDGDIAGSTTADFVCLPGQVWVAMEGDGNG